MSDVWVSVLLPVVALFTSTVAAQSAKDVRGPSPLIDIENEAPPEKRRLLRVDDHQAVGPARTVLDLARRLLDNGCDPGLLVGFAHAEASTGRSRWVDLVVGFDVTIIQNSRFSAPKPE